MSMHPTHFSSILEFGYHEMLNKSSHDIAFGACVFTVVISLWDGGPECEQASATTQRNGIGGLLIVLLKKRGRKLVLLHVLHMSLYTGLGELENPSMVEDTKKGSIAPVIAL